MYLVNPTMSLWRMQTMSNFHDMEGGRPRAYEGRGGGGGKVWVARIGEG